MTDKTVPVRTPSMQLIFLIDFTTDSCHFMFWLETNQYSFLRLNLTEFN